MKPSCRCGNSGCSTALTNDSNEDSQVASPKWHWKSHKQIQSRHDVYNFNSHIMIAEFHSNRFQTNKLVYSKPGSWVQPVWKTWVKHKHGKTVIQEPGSLLLTYPLTKMQNECFDSTIPTRSLELRGNAEVEWVWMKTDHPTTKVSFPLINSHFLHLALSNFFACPPQSTKPTLMPSKCRITRSKTCLES